MPDIDDLLRAAWLADEPWPGDTEAARREVQRRHRRHLVTRRYLAASAVAATAAAVIALTAGDVQTPRGVEPADPAPTSDAASSTPLEGRWTSAPMGAAEVRAAARSAGTPDVAAAMLGDLPRTPFLVVVVVRGAGLTTYVEGPAGRRVDLDQESVIVDGTS